MNLDELRSVLDEERETGTIQPLRPTFYAEARSFIEELETERDRLADESDEPFSDPEVGRLSDRLDSARGVLEAIFENRVGKILSHGATAATGDATDTPELTREEIVLYETVVEAIRETRAAAITGETAVTDDGAGAESEPTPEPEASADPPTEEVESRDEPRIDRLTVRITADVGTILGLDEREYELSPGDVVSLPAENARALIERDAAKGIDG